MKKSLLLGTMSLLLIASCKKADLQNPKLDEAMTTSESATENSGKGTTQPATNAAAKSVVYSSTDNYAVYSDGGKYAAYNDAWGTGTNNTQRINCYSTTNWYTTANYTTGSGGVKTYPHSTDQVGIYAGSLNTCTSNFDYSVPTNGTCDRSYDIWLGSNDTYEVMLWMGRTGNPNPIATNYDANGHAVAELSNQNIGGHTWNVYRRQNSNGKYVYSFLRTTSINSGTVDIKAMLNWLRNRGWMGNEKLNRIEFGFEIFSGNGNWYLNSFSTNVN